MSKTLIGFVAFSIIILGFLPFASAENNTATIDFHDMNEVDMEAYELTVEIQKYYETYEIPVEFPVGKHGCATYYDGPKILKQCYWEAERTTEDYEANYTYDPDTDTIRPTEEIEAEAIAECEANPECPRGIYVPIEEPTKWEQIRDNINPDTESATDQELIATINNLLGARCYQGVGTTAGSQNERDFEIPTITIPVYELIDGEYVDTGETQVVLDTSSTISSLDFKGILGQLERATYECVAQGVLLDEQGGIMSAQDTNFAFCDDLDTSITTMKPICGKTYDHQTNAKDVPTWSQERVNAESNLDRAGEPSYNIDFICNGYYSLAHKQAVGCTIEYDQSGYSTRSSEIQNDVEDAYKEYLADGGKSMAEDLRKQIIADKIAELYRQVKQLEGQK